MSKVKLIFVMLVSVITLLVITGKITGFSFSTPSPEQAWSVLKLAGYGVGIVVLAIVMLVLIQYIEKTEGARNEEDSD